MNNLQHNTFIYVKIDFKFCLKNSLFLTKQCNKKRFSESWIENAQFFKFHDGKYLKVTLALEKNRTTQTENSHISDPRGLRVSE